MSRAPRLYVPEGLFHVISRGNRRQTIFHTPQEFQKFLYLLAFYVREHGMILLAYCLMPNHFHLFLRVGTVPLGPFMQGLLTSYSAWWNAKSHQRGHVFQGRYYAGFCKTDDHLVTLVRYVHFNPVKGKLVQDVRDWPWSSVHAYLGKDEPWISTQTTLDLLSENPQQALKRFQTLLNIPVTNPLKPSSVSRRSHKVPAQAPATPPKFSAPTEIPLVANDQLLQLVSQISGISVEEILGHSRSPLVTAIRCSLAEATRRWWGWNHVRTAKLINKSHVAILKMRRDRLPKISGMVERNIILWETELRKLHS